jgi:hypothetical protein
MLKNAESTTQNVKRVNKVYVVLYYNYGDQGVDFRGCFSSKELAQKYINKTFKEDEARWCDIEEEVVDERI